MKLFPNPPVRKGTLLLLSLFARLAGVGPRPGRSACFASGLVQRGRAHPEPPHRPGRGTGSPSFPATVQSSAGPPTVGLVQRILAEELAAVHPSQPSLTTGEPSERIIGGGFPFAAGGRS